MDEMMAVLGFSAQDLQANQRGIITDSQHRRILAREKLKKWMGFALALVFFCLGGMTLGWVFYGIEVQTKHGEIVPVWFLSSVGSAALLLSAFFTWTGVRADRSLKQGPTVESVLTVDVRYEEIEFGLTGRGAVPYLRVGGLALGQVPRYRSGLFRPGMSYRFYFTSSSRNFLSVVPRG